MSNASDQYIPALKFHWLTPLYDSILHWTLRETTFKTLLVKQARIEPDHHVLDLGCGTATLTLLIKAHHPSATIVGLDGDPAVLDIAKVKRSKANLDITLDQGMSFELPYANNSFTRVVSSLFFHHLTHENKKRTLAEVYRILQPSGELHIADWGKAQNPLMRLAFLSIQFLDGFETTQDNVSGRLPDLFSKAGFISINQPVPFITIYGTLSLYSLQKPANPLPTIK